MRELLLSYLLDELPPEERHRIEQRIQTEPRLRRELEKLRACLEGDSADLSDCEPPQGLADRTLSRVVCLGAGAAWAGTQQNGGESAAESAAQVTGLPRAAQEYGLLDTTSRWRAVDLIVAASIVLFVGALFSPALQDSRAGARQTTCLYNMQTVGSWMDAFSVINDGKFPPILPGQNAGYFAVYLADGEYVNRDEMPRRFVCPSSDLAQLIADGKVVLRIPTAAQIALLEGEELREARRLMAGDIAYRLGYLDRDDQYRVMRNLDQPLQPLLSEAPRVDENGQLRGCNHGKGGQNVVFHALNGKFVFGVVGIGPDDNLFSNNAGEQKAGYGPNDSVVVGSWVTPGVPFTRVARPESLPDRFIVLPRPSANPGSQ